MAIVTAAEVAARTGLDQSGTDYTNTWIPAASALAAVYCGYLPATVDGQASMEQTTYTVYTDDGTDQAEVDLEDARKLHLGTWPVTSITSIHEDEEWGFGASTEVSSSDWVLRGSRGEIVTLKPTNTHGTWSRTYGALKVVFVAGWSDGNAPDQLKQAVSELAAHLQSLKHRRGHSARTQQQVVTSYRTEDIPSSVREMLALFRLPRVLV